MHAPLVQAFDPELEGAVHGHGKDTFSKNTKHILHHDLKTIPRQPQVQLVGNGTLHDHEGLAEVSLAAYCFRPRVL